MSQSDQEELQARYAGLQAAIDVLGKELLVLESDLVAVTVITSWKTDDPRHPQAQFLTRTPGILTPLVAGRVLASCANTCGSLASAVMTTAQEIDHELAARTREAQALAEQRQAQVSQDDGPKPATP